MARPHSAYSDDSGGDEAGQPLIPMGGSPSTARQQGQNSLRRRRQQSEGGFEGAYDSDEERYGARDSPRRVHTSSRMHELELPDLAPEVREWSRTSVVERNRSPLDEVCSQLIVFGCIVDALLL